MADRALQPRAAVDRMAPYSPPTSGREGKLRLDFNENTVGCAPHIVDALTARLSQAALTVYPEYEATRAALSRFFGVPDSQFALTNGTDEAIQILVNTYVDDGDEVVVLHPSYAMYRFYAEVAGASVIDIPYLEGTLAFPMDQILAAITPRTRAILISNPNNPTGSSTGLAELKRIAAAAPQAAVLVDEAYYEFFGVTAIPELAYHPNLFVSRTFSKAYGMAALRIGVLFSQADNIRYVRKAQSPYSVNLLAAIAARAAVEDSAYVSNYVKSALAARDLLYAGFLARNLHAFPSHANFVLFRAGDRSIEIRDALRARGVLVRDRSYEIPGCIRVTAGTPEQSQRFFAALDEVLAK